MSYHFFTLQSRTKRKVVVIASSSKPEDVWRRVVRRFPGYNVIPYQPDIAFQVRNARAGLRT